MYKYLNNKFINSSIKVKIELYLLPFMILFLVYYWGFDNFVKVNKIEENISIKPISSEKKFDEDFLKLFSNIENLAKENQIFVKSISEKNSFVYLSGTANKENFLQFLKEIENLNDFTKVDSFVLSLEFDSYNYAFNIRIDLNNFYIKEKQEKVKEDKVEVETNHTFILNGIVDKYALLNGNWLQINEFIEGYKLVQINRNFVLLRNENKEIKLELNHEEYFKRDN